MDTKSKRLKPFISFQCFFLSIIILIGTLIAGIYEASRYDYFTQKLSDAFNPDFQDTYMFRDSIGDQLQSMLNQLSKKNDGNNIYWNDLNEDSGKNMLYSAGTDKNPAEFTNYAPGFDWNNGALPDGYNFKLYFDGKKVTITKDGKNIDVYGDDIYRSNKGMWYLPGYSNTNFQESNIQNSRITIVVRKELAESFESRNFLLRIPADQSRIRTLVYVCGGMFLLGIILFALYILLRKDKRLADLELARFSGWFWCDFKLICTILLFFADFIFIESIRPSNWFYWGICTVISFFCYYLVVNDIRYNPQFYTHNIFNSALKNYRELETKKPFQKQMILRFWALLASEISIVVFALLAFRFSLWMIDYDNTRGFIFVLCVIAAMSYLVYLYVRRYRNTVNDMGLLIDHISLIKSGNFTPPIELPSDADLNKAALDLSEIQSGVSKAVDERLKSERMKIDLITNVSHDIKTPLTSIISYVDLLSQEENLPDHVKDYIQVLAQKSDRLKNMVQDIFDVSKATSGNIELNMEILDFGKLIRQTLADMDEEIEASGLVFKVDVPDNPMMIFADGLRLYRVFQNLIGNALQYSLEGSRVFVTLNQNEKKFIATVKNISKYELDNEKDMTERFVRGDSSRTTSGSGLGLSIARSFTEACGGSFRILINADLFIAEVSFNSSTNDT